MIDYEIEVINSDKYKQEIQEFMKEYLYDFSKEELFGGFSNEEIKSLKYNEKVYEIPDKYPQRFNTKLEINETGNIGVLVNIGNGRPFVKIGEINQFFKDKIINYLENDDFELLCYLTGGRYKLATIKEDGSEALKSYREDYKFKITFKKKVRPEPVNEVGSNVGQKLENFGNAMQNTGNSVEQIGCYIFMLPLGLFCIWLIIKILF